MPDPARISATIRGQDGGTDYAKNGVVIFDYQSPTEHDDEEHAHDAANEHDRGAFPVADLFPSPAEHESRDGEDGTSD